MREQDCVEVRHAMHRSAFPVVALPQIIVPQQSPSPPHPLPSDEQARHVPVMELLQSVPLQHGLKMLHELPTHAGVAWQLPCVQL